MSRLKANPLIAVFITVFIDMLGIGIILPILPPLIIQNNIHIFSDEVSLYSRNIIYGVVSSLFSLAGFFGSPFLGFLSDKYGRRKVLLYSVMGTFMSYVLITTSTLIGSLSLLCIARLVGGFSSGNISVAFAAIADVSDAKSKSKNFALIGLAFGLGFILGPFLGGVLSDNSTVSWFNSSTPLMLTAILAFINLLFIRYFLPETYFPTTRNTNRLTLLKGFHNIQNALKKEKIRALIMSSFFHIFGFAFFMHFFQVYVLNTFQVSAKEIGFIFGYVGLWIVLTQGVLIRFLVKKITDYTIASLSLFGLGIAILFILTPHYWQQYFFIVPFVAIFNGLISPSILALISKSTSPQEQGEIFGIQQSVQSVGVTIPPLIAGGLLNLHSAIPILCASFFILVSAVIMQIKRREINSRVN